MLTVKDIIRQRLVMDLMDRANNINLYFDAYEHSDQLFAFTQDDDWTKLEPFRDFWGGGVVSSNWGGGNLRSLANIARGEYMWLIRHTECYLFCRDISDDLAKHCPYKFDPCNRSRMEYMSREGNRYLKAQS
jgi:hypothetical protein